MGKNTKTYAVTVQASIPVNCSFFVDAVNFESAKDLAVAMVRANPKAFQWVQHDTDKQDIRIHNCSETAESVSA